MIEETVHRSSLVPDGVYRDICAWALGSVVRCEVRAGAQGVVAVPGVPARRQIGIDVRTAKGVDRLFGIADHQQAGVGLIPSGSGCMELARSASLKAGDGDLFPHLKPLFEIVATGKVATSAEMAREYGFLRESDIMVMNSLEALHAALAEVRVLNAAGYRQPPEMPIRAGGLEAIASFRRAMTRLHEAGYISDHDLRIASEVANALCGGAIEAGALLDEDRYLLCEREGFHRLIGSPETQARIRHTLDTGKPLRN